MASAASMKGANLTCRFPTTQQQNIWKHACFVLFSSSHSTVHLLKVPACEGRRNCIKRDCHNDYPSSPSAPYLFTPLGARKRNTLCEVILNRGGQLGCFLDMLRRHSQHARLFLFTRRGRAEAPLCSVCFSSKCPISKLSCRRYFFPSDAKESADILYHPPLFCTSCIPVTKCSAPSSFEASSNSTQMASGKIKLATEFS